MSGREIWGGGGGCVGGGGGGGASLKNGLEKVREGDKVSLKPLSIKYAFIASMLRIIFFSLKISLNKACVGGGGGGGGRDILLHSALTALTNNTGKINEHNYVLCICHPNGRLLVAFNVCYTVKRYHGIYGIKKANFVSKIKIK